MADALTKAGRYEVVSELGRGSMGVVYEGFDPVISRRVAIKTMLTEGLTPQEFQEFKARFQREAQAAGVLSHPNIVNVFDYGEDGGVLYLIMEYLEGKSLEKLVAEQGLLPIQTIIPMYEQVCSALDHAHEHNVVHRDIKPANIMILDNGLVKVTDFGIAKMMSMGMTQAGQILGTPNYMSPEQVKGRQVDGRSDIFSLGIILYDLVTGEMPFGGQNITTVIYKIINENPIPPRELDATIHPGLSYVICKALAKNPDERYQTCRELADDLKNFKSLGGPTSPSATVMVKSPPLAGLDLERAGAPPAGPAEAAPAAPIEPPPPAPVTVQVTPAPVLYQKPPTAPAVPLFLAVGAVVILAILVGGAYYLYKSRLAALQVGQLSVEANVPGAKISLDGKTDPAWVTPYTIPDLPVGSRQVVVSKEGYEDYQGSVTIEGGKTNNFIASLVAKPPEQPQPATEELAPGKVSTAKKVAEAPGAGTVSRSAGGGPGAKLKVGQLQVTANVSGATLSIDGGTQSNWSPSSSIDLAAGYHHVVVSKEGYDDYAQGVTIEGGKTYRVNAQLTEPAGEVDVPRTPSGVDVFIDGKLVGPGPKPVKIGEHKFFVRGPWGTTQVKTFNVESGGTVFLRVPTEAGGEVGTSVVTVNTAPAGASVTADGNATGGQTPTSFRLTPGRHTLVISRPGCRAEEVVVEVTAGQPHVENVRLACQK
jgi:predicted Ser/Thr protein kinase